MSKKKYGVRSSEIEKVGVNTLVTACANCHMVIEEDLENLGMDMEVVSLTEMVADHLDNNYQPSSTE